MALVPRFPLAIATLLTACAPTPPPAATATPEAPAPAPEAPTPAPETPEVAAAPASTCEPLEVKLPEVPMAEKDPPIPEVVDPDRLAAFFEKAARVLRGKATDHVRIAVYGDSNLTMDFQTGQMRRTLQQTYGDAGHGFVALGRPWSHYKHMDVEHDMKKGWQAYACSTDPTPDRMYGISGIAAESLSMNSVTYVATVDPKKSPIGHTASRFNLYFLKGPRRGAFEIRVDGKTLKTVDAKADAAGLGVETFEVEDAPHRVEAVVTDADHRARMLGITLERAEKPSFVVDSFGVGSMNTESQWKQDPAINHAMLQHRGYDLVVFATGANDGFTLDVTPKCLDDMIARHREALPDAPILFVTPSDRGKDKTSHRLKKIIAQRYEIAKKNDAALWDMWKAMGGEGSMRTFYERGMAINDHVHFNEKGGTYMGQRLTYALWSALKRYVEEHPQAGCDAPPAVATQ